MSRRSGFASRLFNNYFIDSTDYVYDDAGGSAGDSGWIDVEEIQHKLVQVGVTIDDIDSIEMQIEGKIHREASPAKLDSKSFTGSTDIDEIFDISKYPVKEIRVGFKVTGIPGSGDNRVTAYGAFDNDPL